MSKVEGGGPIDSSPPPSSVRATIFFFKACRVNQTKEEGKGGGGKQIDNVLQPYVIV